MTFRQISLLYLITLAVFFLIDMVWGTVLGGSVSLVSALIGKSQLKL